MDEDPGRGWRSSLLPPLRRALTRPSTWRRDPRLPIRVEVAREAWPLTRQGGDEVTGIVADRVARDLAALGLDAAPAVELRVVAATPRPTGLEIFVLGRRCAYPESLLRDDGPEAGPPAADEEPPVRLADAVLRVLQHRASVLLGPGQLGSYRALLQGDDADDPFRAVADADLGRLLRDVLDVGVSLQDHESVRAVLTDAIEHEDRNELVVERLIDRLRPPAIHIRIAPSTLRDLCGRLDRSSTAFPELRKDLFTASGTLLPDVRLTADDTVAPGRFALTLQALPTGDHRMTDSGDPLAQFAARLRDTLTWRRHWFVCSSSVTEQLDGLHLAFPELVAAVRLRYPDEWLSALLRTLVQEQLSVRNLAAVLDHLLDLDADAAAGTVVRLEVGRAGAAEGRPWLGLPPPSVALPFIRQRSLERHWRVAGQLPADRVVLADPEVEEAAARFLRSERDHDADRVLAAVDAGLQHTTGGPALVTSSVSARTAVRAALGAQLPEAHVLAAVELPPPVLVLGSEAAFERREERGAVAAPSE